MLLLIIVTRSLSRLPLEARDWVSLIHGLPVKEPAMTYLVHG
jgi:hypothetical protein